MIESEAGGSSVSKLMVNMKLAAETGGADLENFAKVAGVSASEFATSFNEDPMTAIVGFVEGLGKIDKSGGSTIKVLDDMGIKEIRMRDALLRLAGGSDILAEAVNTSSTAWEENSALTTEAEKRYATSASQLQLLKNEVTGMAIDLGQELLPVLLDLVDMARPVIDGIKGMIKSFADSSDETKKFAVNLLGIVVGGGFALKALSLLGGGIGGVTKIVGLGMKSWKGFTLGLEAAKVSSGLLTASSATLSGGAGIGGLTTSVGLAGTALLPIAGLIGGITLAVGLGYGAWKLWGEDAYNASEQTKKWGYVVGEEADKALTEFQDLSTEAGIATAQMATNIEEGTGKAIAAYDGMADEIKEDLQTTITETEEGLAELPESVRKIIADTMTAGVAEQTKLIQEIDEIQAGITAVYQTALEENRSLTEAELVIVENYHTRMAEIRSESLKLGAEEEEAAHAKLTEDFKSFSKEQLRQRIEMLHEETTAIGETYEEQAQLIKDSTKPGEERNAALAALDRERNSDMESIGMEYIKIWEAQGDVSEDVQRKLLADMGLNYDEIQARIDLANQKIAQSNMIVTDSTKKVSEEVRKANDTWNGMELFDKDGKLTTNATATIQEASQSEQGWKDLQYLTQHAELDTNSKETIQDALMANGMWWEMDFPPQFADLETNAGQTANYYLDANGKWEGLEYETKTAILKTNSTEELQKVLIDTGVWETLNPTEQELIMTTNAGAAAKEALIATGVWNELPIETKKLIVSSNTKEEADKAIQDAGNWNGKEWVPKNIVVKSNATEKSKSGIGAAQNWNNKNWNKKSILVDSNAPTKTNAAIEKAQQWNRQNWNPKDILVESNASKIATAAQTAINGVVGKTVNIRTIYSKLEAPSTGTPYKLTGGSKAAGSNFTAGGATMLGDGGQNEPFMTPDGQLGLSPKQDTVYDLPRGTKVWRNIESLMSSLPHFATGTLNEPIKVGDKTFNQLTDALIPFNIPSVTNGSEMMRESSSQATNVEGDTYNLYLTANGDLPKATIKKMAKTIQQEIKNTNDRKKFSRGEVVTP